MLKRLPVLAKVLLGCAVIIGAIVSVTRYEQNAARYYKAKCQENVTKVTVPFLPEEQPTKSNQCQDPKEYMPWWYVLVAWPEGIAAWGLLFTLGAIIWQSWETRKSAEATESSARPRRNSPKT